MCECGSAGVEGIQESHVGLVAARGDGAAVGGGPDGAAGLVRVSAVVEPAVRRDGLDQGSSSVSSFMPNSRIPGVSMMIPPQGRS